jgi:hypothetical protein
LGGNGGYLRDGTDLAYIKEMLLKEMGAPKHQKGDVDEDKGSEEEYTGIEGCGPPKELIWGAS